MINVFPTALRRTFALAAFGTVLGALLMLPGPAQARVWVGFGFPFYFGPPAYYAPPPAYYYPPPAYYPPPYYPPPAPYYPPPVSYVPRPGGPAGQSCYAGAAVCPMERSVAPGAACYCTTAQGQVWGRAN
jgi:hypothetical protein